MCIFHPSSPFAVACTAAAATANWRRPRCHQWTTTEVRTHALLPSTCAAPQGHLWMATTLHHTSTCNMPGHVNLTYCCRVAEIGIGLTCAGVLFLTVRRRLGPSRRVKLARRFAWRPPALSLPPPRTLHQHTHVERDSQCGRPTRSSAY